MPTPYEKTPVDKIRKRMVQTKRPRRRGTGAGFGGRQKGYVPLRTGFRRGGAASARETKPYGDMPANWQGTEPEWAIYWAHTQLQLKEDSDFAYQYFFDNGLIFDFFEFDVQVAIEIQGLFWHYAMGGHKIIADQTRKAIAEAQGFQLVFIDEDHAMRDPLYYLRAARSGIDRSRVMTGF